MAPLAFFFDWLDGNVARWRHQPSALGRELDSLADVISFGVAPAALAYAAGLDGGWDAVVLIYFVCCGVSRARALQRHRRDARGRQRQRQGRLLRRHADPDQRGADGGARVRRVAGPASDKTSMAAPGISALPIAPAVAALLRLGQHDDQQDPAHSEAVAAAASVSRASAVFCASLNSGDASLI